MSEILSGLRIPSFHGLHSNRDPREIEPGGAAAQVNVTTHLPGRLAVRKGVRPYTFSGSVEIASGLNTFRRLCFCRARNGDLFAVNGVDAPLRWDGMTAASEEAGVRAPAAGPSVSTPTGGAATEGNYDCYVRYIDDTLPQGIPGNLSPVTTVTAAEDDKFSWTIPASIPGRATKTELWRSTAYAGTDSPNTIYKIATLDEGDTTYADDTNSDNDLLASSDEDTMKILLEDGSLNANRFIPPPNDRPIMVMYQDRYWFAGQVNYNRGTVATAGTTTVSGTGTDWTSAMVGRYIAIEGEARPYEITAVGDDDSITVDTAVANTDSELEYVIYPDPSGRRKLLYSEVDEPESVPTTNTITLQESTGDDDELTGLVPRGAYLFILTERHRYALTYARQPRIDANLSLVDDRGMLHQWCWDSFDDIVFAMDESGPYLFHGAGRAEPIDAAIHDLWREGTIDLAKQDKFFVKVDRAQERVYFFVCYTTDSEDLPRRALVYNVRTATWDHFEYPLAISSAALARIDGEPYLLLAAEGGVILRADQGTTDIVASETRGAVTSATATTLTDSGASFTTSMVGAPVYIYAGKGKGQRRTITARTSTQLTVAAWTTTPDTTSRYIIGAVVWNWKSGRYAFVRAASQNERSVRLAFSPTGGDSRLDLRLYYDYDADPEEHHPTPHVQGESVQVDEANPEDIVFHLESDQSDQENKRGYEQFRFDGRLEDRHHTDRALSVELRGFQGDDPIAIDEIEINGVIAGE